MTLKKLERAITLIKAQIGFLATQQKDSRSINKNIIAYSRIAAKNIVKPKTSKSGAAKKFVKTKESGLTFQVYSHLNKGADTL